MSRPNRPNRTVPVAVAAALTASLLTTPAYAAPAEPEMFCTAPGEELAISPIGTGSDDEGAAVTWKSTTKGTTPTEFTGEFLGTLDNALGSDAYGNPRDLYLVRLSGETVDGTPNTMPAGVWAGASGSPVYDENGALIGAVSYGFSWQADNVAGVTPAAAMKSIGDLPSSVKLSAASKAQLNDLIGTAPSGGLKQLQPVRVGGTKANALADDLGTRLKKTVKGYKQVKINGRAGGGGTGGEVDAPLVAGGNLAVSYAYGAQWFASVGTVTAICGDKVWAFGHPNNANSKLISSFHNASAARIVPNAGDSYKLVSKIGAPQGVITDDRTAGIRGSIGATTATYPVTSTSIVGDTRSKKTSYVTEKLALAEVVYLQIADDATRMLDNAWAGSARVSWSIDYKRANGKTGTLKNANRYADDTWLPELVGFDVATDVALLQNNGFEKVTVTAVRVTTTFDPEVQIARVKGVEMKKNGVWTKVAKGSSTKVTRNKTYEFRAVLSPSPYSESTAVVRVPFSVKPPNSLKKTLSLKLDGGQSEDFSLDADFEQAPPKNFDAYVALLDKNERSDQFTITRKYTTTGNNPKLKTSKKTAPTVIDGGSFSFKLVADPIKKAKKK